MGNPATVPIVAPNGQIGDVPYARMHDAIAAGGKPGVTFKSPDGKLGVIPADRMPDAVKAGGTIVPFEQQETQHPGFWKTLADFGESAASGLYHAAVDPLTDTHADLVQKLHQEDAADAAAESSPERQAHGAFYRNVSVPAAEAVGVRVPTMEAHAAKGDVNAVLGEAAGPLAVMGATEGLTRGAPAAADLAKPYFDAVKSTVEHPVTAARTGIANAADLGATVLDNDVTGMISPRAAHAGKMLGKVADVVRPPQAKPSYPGAPYPDIPQEVRQGAPLAQGGATPAPEPASAGLGKIPVPPSEVAAPDTRLPAAFQPLPSRPPAVPGTVDAPFQVPAEPAAAPETRLPAAFQPLPKTAPPVPGTVDLPFKSLMELPPAAVDQAIQEVGAGAGIPQITERANRIALKSQIEAQLNDAVGYKPPALEPGKPIYRRPLTNLKQQIADAAEKPAAQPPRAPLTDLQKQIAAAANPLPEGFTATPDSSLLQGYKYDPAKQEFRAVLNNGETYTHGEVTPDQVKAFEDADSQGNAWTKKIKQGPGTVLVEKNGIPVRKVQVAADKEVAPRAAPAPVTAAPPKSSPPTYLDGIAASDLDDLTDIVEKSLRRATRKGNQ